MWFRKAVLLLRLSASLSTVHSFRILGSFYSSSTKRFAMTTIHDIALETKSSLPVDTITENYCRKVPNAIFSRVTPTPVKSPLLVAYSKPALALLGITDVPNEQEVAEYLSGNQLLPGSIPMAHCYCGHQFGSFAGQLGDGAAILLGSSDNPISGEQWELQLKGAGLTPYSRNADGRKVLRSSIREFLGSEHLFALKTGTTRAGTVITSFETTVTRDPYYDNNIIQEPCTIVSRIAPHFFRFGSFEIFRPNGPSYNNHTLKQQLLHHIFTTHYPHLLHNQTFTTTTTATTSGVTGYPRLVPGYAVQSLYREIAQKTAWLVAQWQTIGFVHGVLNTDNLSIDGITIDYGPYGFLEYYDPEYTPNGSDHSARYAYSEQPTICGWNLGKLGEALNEALILEEEEEEEIKEGDESEKKSPKQQQVTTIIQETIQYYQQCYTQYIHALWKMKLGCLSSNEIERIYQQEEELLAPLITDATATTIPSSQSHWFRCQAIKRAMIHVVDEQPSDHETTEKDRELIDNLLETMAATVSDFTDVFVALTEYQAAIISSDNNNAEELQQLQQQLLTKILSRCATVNTIKRLHQRKQRIHRSSIPSMQLTQLIQIANTNSSLLLRMFPGADINEIKQELLQEQRKMDLAQGSIIFQELMKLNQVEKDNRDRQLWSQWIEQYTQRMQLLRLNNYNNNNNNNNNPMIIEQQRLRIMQANNPVLILRNWMAQRAIEQAEKHRNFQPVRELLTLVTEHVNDYSLSSFKQQTGTAEAEISGVGDVDVAAPITTSSSSIFLRAAPDWADELICTCSS
jgi:uncharacterized protein YdiU (UPF0061 family)